jgi:hypothetical protein
MEYEEFLFYVIRRYRYDSTDTMDKKIQDMTEDGSFK